MGVARTSLLLVIATLAAGFVGCSSSEDKVDRTERRGATERDRSRPPDDERSALTPGPACPRGTKKVLVSDLLQGRQDRYDVLEPADQPPVVAVAQAVLASRPGDVDVKILAPPGRQLGTVVAVLNATETIDLDELVKGAKARARQTEGIRVERRTLAGKPGLIMVPAGGGNIALAPIAPCAALVLSDSERSSLLGAADALAAP